MATFSVEFRNEIVSALQDLIRTSEEIYLHLGNAFPALLREMDASVERNRELTARLHQKSETRADDELGNAIAATREIVSEGRERFEEMRVQNDRLFEELDRSLGRLESFGEHVNAIKEDSEEMELISLNAMTVALKAGSAGRAFSFITDELKRLAGSTIEMTDHIEQRGRHLQTVFHEFRGQTGSVAAHQRDLFSNAADRLEESFEAFRAGLERIGEVLERMNERSLDVKQPLQKIMEEVQLHDLVKQSVDHVIISLTELNHVSSTSTTEEALDELTFFEQMPALCHEILDDVAARIRSSVDLFREQSQRASTIIEAVQKEARSFVDAYVDGRQQDVSSIDELYERSSDVLAKLQRDLRDSLRQKQRISDRSDDLMRQVNRLNNDLRKFSVLVNRFRSVDVHSRIEVSKQKVLQEMSGTVEEMTELTGRIASDVGASLEDTTEFMDRSAKTLANARTVFEEEADFVRRFSRRINDRYEELSAARSTLNDAAAGHSAFTARFLTLFEEAKGHHDSLERLVDTIGGVKERLDEVRAQAAEEKRRLLSERGYDHWNIESERLKEIIERFTIFTHKATAGGIGGFEVERGAESGEVTLF